MSYEDAVEISGRSGHSRVGLNEEGFFGITAPEPGTALELLLSARGLLTLTPVLAVAVFGLWLAARRDRRAEALTAGAVALRLPRLELGLLDAVRRRLARARFLIPVLPFLALGLASAWRARPAVTAALTVPSVVMMLAATLTRPLIGDPHSAGDWAALIERGAVLQHAAVRGRARQRLARGVPVAAVWRRRSSWPARGCGSAWPRTWASRARRGGVGGGRIDGAAPWGRRRWSPATTARASLIGAGVLGAAAVLWWASHEGRDIHRGRSRVADGSQTDEFETVVTV